MSFDQIRDSIVLTALPSVSFDGWTMTVLTDAACQSGMDPTMAERAFPEGPIQAVQHFTRLADRLMQDDCAGLDLLGMRVPDRLCALIEARLTRWAPHREAIRRAVSMLALPIHAPVAVALTWGTADALWRAAGDSSHDFSWYTRRMTLSTLYSAVMMYWLDDPSEDCRDSMAFLRRRLADIGRFHQSKTKVASAVSSVLPARLAALVR